MLRFVQSSVSTTPPHERLMTYRPTLTQDPSTYAFVWRENNHERRCGGLLRFLQARLYPNYQPPERRRNERSSRSQGERIHRHLAHAVNCSADGQCSCQVKRPVCTNVMNKHARSLLTQLETLKITPVRCEVPIVSPQWNVGTRIDLIGKHENGEWVLISIKTGYERHFNRRRTVGAQLCAPLSEWPDTPLSHHRAQLLAEYLICKHEYGVVFDQCLILYAAKSSRKRAGQTSDNNQVHVATIDNLSRLSTRIIFDAIKQ